MLMKLKTYTPELRAEAVKLMLEQGLSQEQAAANRGAERDDGQLGERREAQHRDIQDVQYHQPDICKKPNHKGWA